MSEYIILREPYVTVLADTTVPCVLVQLHAFANREQFQQVMNLGLDYYQRPTNPQQP